MNDEQLLIRLCLGHDPDAWTRLRHIITRMAETQLTARFCRDVVQVEDVVEAVLAELLRNDMAQLRDIPRHMSIDTCLDRIVFRIVALSLDTAAQQCHCTATADHPAAGPAPRPDLDYISPHVLARLSPYNRLILLLDQAGYSGQEIADRLTGIHGTPFSITSVRQRKAHALRQLASAMHA